MTEEKQQIDFKSLSKKARRTIRNQFMKAYGRRLRVAGMKHSRVQVRTLVDRAVSMGKLSVAK